GSTGCSVNGVYGFDCRNVITVSNESEGTTISDVLAEETAHTAIDVRNGSQNTIVDDVTITDYEAQQRIAVQVNNGAGNVEFSNFDIHSQ
ncbi:hypothetical protein N3930_45140, partial [Bacillus thuringiensis]|nr:hypothetical protein [Bacillus thuringiensis]